MTRQLWKGTLAELSAKDYFAVGAQAYFRDSQTRQEFSDYDPGMNRVGQMKTEQNKPLNLKASKDSTFIFRTVWLGKSNFPLWQLH